MKVCKKCGAENWIYVGAKELKGNPGRFNQKAWRCGSCGRLVITSEDIEGSGDL